MNDEFKRSYAYHSAFIFLHDHREEKEKKSSFTSRRIRYEVIDRVLSRIRRSAYSDRFPRGSAVIFLTVYIRTWKIIPYSLRSTITHDRESMLSRLDKIRFPLENVLCCIILHHLLRYILNIKYPIATFLDFAVIIPLRYNCLQLSLLVI